VPILKHCWAAAACFALWSSACGAAEEVGLSENPMVGSARMVRIGEAWAKNTVNTVIFRTDAVTTHGDTQYAAYYDPAGRMVLAKRKLGSDKWHTRLTRFTGNVKDAHCCISIAADGRGYLHVSWGHHNIPLRYARSVYPGSLLLSDPIPMTGQREQRVTYPEFFKLGSGDLICMYRDGMSGSGDTILNLWSAKDRQWRPVQHPLISGEGQRNAYTNGIAVDRNGVWHISWCWRETGDVATNHDICYARSSDGGLTWTKSTGEKYELPITEANAEVVCRVPQRSDMINHCSMAVDSRGNPMIATYWRPEGASAPQYHLIRHDGTGWRVGRVGNRTLDFKLEGFGTRRPPASRPDLAVDREDRVYVLFRDRDRGDKVSVGVSDDSNRERWSFVDLTADSVGLWEPNYDRELWERDGILHIFVQRCGQGEAETTEDLPPQPVSILEWRPDSAPRGTELIPGQTRG